LGGRRGQHHGHRDLVAAAVCSDVAGTGEGVLDVAVRPGDEAGVILEGARAPLTDTPPGPLRGVALVELGLLPAGHPVAGLRPVESARGLAAIGRRLARAVARRTGDDLRS